jgi:hypothetical protein
MEGAYLGAGVALQPHCSVLLYAWRMYAGCASLHTDMILVGVWYAVCLYLCMLGRYLSAVELRVLYGYVQLLGVGHSCTQQFPLSGLCNDKLSPK